MGVTGSGWFVSSGLWLGMVGILPQQMAATERASPFAAGRVKEDVHREEPAAYRIDLAYGEL